MKFITLCAFIVASLRPAHAGWIENGTVVCDAIDAQVGVVVVSDGHGGAIMTWEDERNGAPDIFVQRIDSNGVPLWTHNGVAICIAANNQWDPFIVSDGSGGAIIAWTDYRTGISDVYVQRVDNAGNPLWPINGVALCTAPANQGPRAMVADGEGGAIVAFGDRRNFNLDIYAQRVDATGVPLWASNGIAFCTAPNDQYFVSIVTDGAGGMIGTWTDDRTSMNVDVYAQRVDGAGNAIWTLNGIPVGNASNSQRESVAVSDDAGGAIIFWDDYRTGDSDVYAQRLNAAGISQWMANGVLVCTAPNFQGQPRAVSDNNGGAIAVFSDNRSGVGDLVAQRISGAGILQWPTDGISLCDTLTYRLFVSIDADGDGGAVCAFQTYPDENVFAQRMDPDGVRLWDPHGLPISIAPNSQRQPNIVSDGSGGAIIGWYDYRANGDIYAQRVYANGLVPTSVEHPEMVSPFLLRDNYPDPFTGSTNIEFELPIQSLVTLDVFDVAGRRVSTSFRGEMGKGWHRVVFDGRDGTGRHLPSGVYFYRVQANGGSVSRKMVITR